MSMLSPVLILCVLSVLLFVAALVWPNAYLVPVAGILLAVAVLIAKGS